MLKANIKYKILVVVVFVLSVDIINSANGFVMKNNGSVQPHNSNTTKLIQGLNMTRRSRSENKNPVKNKLRSGEEESVEQESQMPTTAGALNTEMTISLPRFHTDAMGNWVYNPWGLTYGKVWEDTRFNVGNRITIPRMHLDSDPVRRYYPYLGTRGTVCLGMSTVYNKPPVKGWLPLAQYNFIYIRRHFNYGLRNTLYKNSEECHTAKFTNFREYQECALRRNQRMEYLLPKYPVYQITPVWVYGRRK